MNTDSAYQEAAAQSGAASGSMLEFALVVGLFFVVLFGVIWLAERLLGPRKPSR